jgi:hypothetical protein
MFLLLLVDICMELGPRACVDLTPVAARRPIYD